MTQRAAGACARKVGNTHRGLLNYSKDYWCLKGSDNRLLISTNGTSAHPCGGHELHSTILHIEMRAANYLRINQFSN